MQVQSRCEFNLQTRLSEALLAAKKPSTLSLSAAYVNDALSPCWYEVSLRASFADRVANNATRIGVIRSLDAPWRDSAIRAQTKERQNGARVMLHSVESAGDNVCLRMPRCPASPDLR